MAYDGKIIFNTKIDNSQVDKDLKQLERKIRQSEESISKNENAKLPLVKQAKEAAAALDEAKAKLAELQRKQKEAGEALSGTDPNAYIDAYANKPQIDAGVESQSRTVNKLQSDWDSLTSKVESYDLKIKQAKADISDSRTRMAELKQESNQTGNRMTQAFSKARASADKFRRQILRIGSSMIMFRLFSAALQGISTYMGKVLKTNSEYTAQLARLKGALLTAFQPIYEAALPGLIKVLEVLTAIARVAANVMSALFGKTASESAESAENLYKEADAITAVNSAAAKAQKSLAGFDQVNRLSSQNSGGSSTGTTTTLPNFEDMSITDNLDNILTLAKSIGAAFLTWKIASAFTTSLSTIAGLAAAVGGAVVYVESWIDAFNNGIDWENLTGLIGGATLVVGGLAVAFGTVGAAIGLLVTGGGLLMAALIDWMDKGKLSTETAVALGVAILAIGAAISLLTGSWIPLIIAAIAGVVALVVDNWDEIVEVWEGAGEWFNEKVVAPIKEYFSGLKSKIKKYLKDALSYVKEKWEGVADWFKEKVTEKIKSKFTSVKKKIKSTFKDAISYVKEKWKGVSDWFTEKVRTPIENVFSKLSKNLKSTINGIIGFLNGMISGIVSGINTVINAINKIRVTIPDWIPEVGGKTIGFNLKTITAPKIPLLAQGAVLPANKPFLAMVGDQKHGTNVEAPLSTIQEAVAIVMEDMIQSNMAGHEATVAVLREILEAILGIQIGDDVISRAVTNYQRKMAVARGG